jgi:hypothetical protein
MTTTEPEPSASMSPDELELAARSVAEQKLRRLNEAGAARGASELEQMVRKWEDEEVAVRKLMDGQHKMFARMVNGAPIGPMVLEPQTPTPTNGLEPSTPDSSSAAAASRQLQQPASPGSGLLLTPSLSLISASPNVRASPAMRKTMDQLMVRQAKIWEQVAGTLGTRVSVMLSSPPIKVPGGSDASNALHADLPALPPISESVDQLKSVYTNSLPKKRPSQRELSRPKPRTLSSESAAAAEAAPPPSPVRTLVPELDKQSTPTKPTKPSKGSKKAKVSSKKQKQAKKPQASAAEGAAGQPPPRAEWNGRIEAESPRLKLPSISLAQPARAGEAGPVRTQSRRPDGADPNLEATQLESKWGEIRNLMVRAAAPPGRFASCTSR